MKTRSTTSDKTQISEHHRQLIHGNQCGDELAPVLPILPNGANPEKLALLVQDFNKAHEELKQRTLGLQAAYARSIAEVANLGLILIEVKKLTKAAKLNWMDWVKDNTAISIKTAQRWMHVARKSSAMSNLTPTAKKLTQHYQDIGILKKRSEPDAGEPMPVDSKENGEDLQKQDDAYDGLFTKAKNMADRLAQLAIQTKDQERMAEAVKSVIAWHEDYLSIKKAAEQKAEQDAAFETETTTAD